MEPHVIEFNNSETYATKIISDSQRGILMVVNYVILCGFVSLFGTVTNIINMTIFHRQGLNTTINISFFSLAVSDLCGLVLQQLFNIYVNPLFDNSGIPLAFTDVQYLTTAVIREIFAKITCFITVYITAERCLCIVFPLHVKQMITPRRTTTVIVCIYSLTFLSTVPLYCTSYIDWQFYPDKNKTLLGLAFRRGKDEAEAAVYFTHAILGALSFVAVVMFTFFLIYKLGQKSNWRNSVQVHQDKAESISKRERSTVSMVVLIASILIICYTPSTAFFLATFIEPEFSVGGRYYNLCYSLWSFGILAENINSSVNIFFYYKMSAKYRHTFWELFSRYLSSDSIVDNRS